MFFMKFHAQSKIINNFRWVLGTEFFASAGSLHRSFNPAEVLQDFIGEVTAFMKFHAQSKIINNFRWVSESEFVASAGSMHRG
jgi:hypothetical protein